MTVSLWQDKGEGDIRSCDAVVVGAGVVGLFAAGELARAGLRVIVLEARDIALGATGRNAGMVVMGLAEHYHKAVAVYGRPRAKEGWNLTIENRILTIALCEHLGVPVERIGGLLLAVDDAEMEELETAAEMMVQDGFEVGFTPHDPTGRGFTAAVVLPHDVAIDPSQFAEALARNSGADIYTNTEVHSLSEEDGAVVVHSRLLTVRARLAVLATNGYSPLVHPYFADKIVPIRGQVLATASCPRVFQTCGYAHYGYEYFRQRADGRFVLGGWRMGYRNLEIGYEDRVTPEIQGGLEGFLARYFPDVTGEITHRWSGVMGFSRDALPLVGRLPDLPHVGFAVGFTGHGLGLGLIGARRVVELLLHNSDPGLISARRFET